MDEQRWAFCGEEAEHTCGRCGADLPAEEMGPHEVVVQGPGERNGYRVSIDDKPLFDTWELLKAFQDHATVDLTAGPHEIVVEDVQRTPFGGRLRLAITDQRKLVGDRAKQLAAKVDAVVAAVGFNCDSEGEGADRTFSLPIGQNVLIHEMASRNKNVIVAITSGGAVAAAAWIDEVPACLEMWYPGEQGGTALAEILFGDVNPSGRLPISFEKSQEDNPSFPNYYPQSGTIKVVYKEGIFTEYRGYEHNGVKPLFPFGFGLSYTTFTFSDLSIKDAGTPTAAKYLVSFDVTNSRKTHRCRGCTAVHRRWRYERISSPKGTEWVCQDHSQAGRNPARNGAIGHAFICLLRHRCWSLASPSRYVQSVDRQIVTAGRVGRQHHIGNNGNRKAVATICLLASCER